MSTKKKSHVNRTVERKVQKARTSVSDSKLNSSRSIKGTDEGKPKDDLTEAKTNKPIEKKTKPEPKILERQKTIQTHSRTKQLQMKSKVNQNNERVLTPPSKRVVKTQFFPTKNNYAEMLDHLGKYEAGGGDATSSKKKQIVQKEIVRKKIKAIDKPNRKIEEEKRDDLSPDKSSEISERPRTSTLRKGSIVNRNIAGPEVPKQITNDQDETIDDPVEYEDDFESYESDFENCSSSDSTVHNISEISTEGESSTSTSYSERISAQKHPVISEKEFEKKLDSGNFDLNEYKKKQEGVNIQELIEKDNAKARTPETNFKSNLTSLSDEGFEESKSLQFMNFAGAKKTYERRKSAEMRKRRGEQLLNMIKLDCVNFTIFDLSPVPYEVYIKRFGNVNSMQIGVQTGEENVDEESQTDEIETRAKWTQMPVHISKIDSVRYRYERVGVGPDLDEISETHEEKKPIFNKSNLEKFLAASGGLVLDLLKDQTTLSCKIQNKSPENTLSEGFVEFKPPEGFLGKRKISYVSFYPGNPSFFLSVHVVRADEEDARSVVYIWNMNDNHPEKLSRVCYGKITSCCFGSSYQTVFAGLENGILVVWETKGDLSLMKNMYDITEEGTLLRNPIFLTDIGNSHCCPIIAIQPVSDPNTHDIHRSEIEDTSTKQICSLDQDGDIIMWGVIIKHEENAASIHWNTIILCRNFRISLVNLLPEMSQLVCTDMIIPKSETNVAIIAANYGCILYCSLNREKPNVKMNLSDDPSIAKCLSKCPFSETCFLAGFENGNINLCSVKTAKALMMISKKESDNINDAITGVQWSSAKPGTFYTRNVKNTIDLWDLNKSNIFPSTSVSFKNNITCLKISLPSGVNKEVYMLIATETSIYMHLLERNVTNDGDYQKSVKTFLNFVNRL